METGKDLSKKARPGEMTLRGTRTPDPVCDYCADGNVAVDGWHTIKDPMGFDGDQRIPCAKVQT